MKIVLVAWLALTPFSNTALANQAHPVVSAAKLCERQLAGPTGAFLTALEIYNQKGGRELWTWQLRNLVRRAGDLQAQQALLHKYFQDHPNSPFEFVAKVIKKTFETRAQRASALLGWMELKTTNIDEFIDAAKWMRQLTNHRPLYLFGSRRLLMPEVVKAFIEKNAEHLSRIDIQRLAKVDPEFAPMIYVSLVGTLAANREDGTVIRHYYDDLGPELYTSTLLSLLEQKPHYFLSPDAFLRLAERSLDQELLVRTYLEENSDLLTKSQFRRMSIAAGEAPAEQAVVVNLADRREAVAQKPPVAVEELATPRRRMVDPAKLTPAPASQSHDFHELALLASEPGMTFERFLTGPVIQSIRKLALASQTNLFLESTIGTRDEKEAQVRDVVFLPMLKGELTPIITTAELLAKIQNPEIMSEMLEAYASAAAQTPGDRADVERKVIEALPQPTMALWSDLLKRRGRNIPIARIANFLAPLAHDEKVLTAAIFEYLESSFESIGYVKPDENKLRLVLAGADAPTLLERLKSESDPAFIRQALTQYAIGADEKAQVDRESADQRRVEDLKRFGHNLSYGELIAKWLAIEDPDRRVEMADQIMNERDVSYDDVKAMAAALPEDERPYLMQSYAAKSGVRLSPEEIENLFAEFQKPLSELEFLSEYLPRLDFEFHLTAKDLIPYFDTVKNEVDRSTLISNYLEYSLTDPEANKLPFPDQHTEEILERLHDQKTHDQAYERFLVENAENLDSHFDIERLLKKMRLPPSRAKLIYAFVTHVKVDANHVMELAESVEDTNPTVARAIRKDRKR